MQNRDYGRDGRGGGGGHQRPVHPFPPFPPPFAGFGDFGMGMGMGGMFPDMFDNDSFFKNDPFMNDPFFTRPFGSLFGSSGGLFGRNGFLGSSMMQPSFGIGNHGGFLDQAPSHPTAEPRRGPVIEELPDDHEAGDSRSKSSQEPIVEHPDDDVKTGEYGRYQQNQHVNSSGPSQSRTVKNVPVQGYSFQSSSVMYGGPNGPYYSSKTTRRQGSDGVILEEHEEKDSVSGKDEKRISRGLYGKGHSLTRKRNAEGREDRLETLHNLDEDEVPDFERSWEARAEKSFPRWNKNRSQQLGSSSRSRPALPSSAGDTGNRLKGL